MELEKEWLTPKLNSQTSLKKHLDGKSEIIMIENMLRCDNLIVTENSSQ